MGIHKGQTLKLAKQHLCQPYWKSSIEQHISSWSSQRPLEMLLLLLTYPLWDQDHARSSVFRVPDRLIRTQCGVSTRCNPTCSKASGRTVLILMHLQGFARWTHVNKLATVQVQWKHCQKQEDVGRDLIFWFPLHPMTQFQTQHQRQAKGDKIKSKDIRLAETMNDSIIWRWEKSF